MTQKEQTEARIVYDKTKIDEIIQSKSGETARPHTAYPYMADLLEQMKLYKDMDGADIDTCCMIFEYLGEQFTYVPYLPSAVECYMLALDCAKVSEDKTVVGEMPELVYMTAKYRNMIARDRYIVQNGVLLVGEDENMLYDACRDIKTGGRMSDDDVQNLIRHAALTAKKSLTADPAEHTPEYAELIFDLHETIFSAFDDEQMKKDDFCFAFWAAKKAYLANHGIKWQTPAALNPSLKGHRA